MADEEERFGEEDKTPLDTILNSVQIYFPIALVSWGLFELGRKRLERAYYCRARSPDTSCPPVEDMKRLSFWKWIVPMYKTNDDVIFAHCGLDTLFFLRFLRMCQKIAGAAIVMSAALFPVYYFAASDGIDVSKLDPLYRMTFSRLDKSETWRFWFPLAAIYAISAYTMYLLRVEYKEYIKRRHEFLGRKETQQYSVVVDGLPTHLRTQQTLRNYLQVLFPNSVLHVYVALECGDLEKFVSERVKVRDKLEGMLAKSAQTGERPMKKKSICGEKVDAIQLYEDHLKQLNDAVEMEVRSIVRNQAALANQMVEVSYDDYQSSSTNLPDEYAQKLQEPVVDGDSPEARKDETEYIHSLKSNRRRARSSGIMRGSAFVTFNNLKAAQAAQQILQCADITHMATEAAPHVEDIVWENVGISYHQKSVWTLSSYLVSTAVVVFWTVPTVFVVNLSKVNELRKSWPWLGGVADDNPWLAPLLEQLSPLMLRVMNSLAPIILGNFSKREGHASNSKVEGSLFTKMVCYQAFITFIIPTVGGSLSELLEAVQDVGELVNKISRVIPAQSSFFITLLIVQLGLELSLELLRVIPIAKAGIYHLYAPKLTPRQRSSAWFGLTPLDCPGDFGQTDTLAQYFLVMILILVFTPIAPVVCYFSGLYFLMSDLMFRWSVLCVNDPSPHSIGVYFPSLYRFCVFALILAQVIMFILFGVKLVPLHAALSLALPAFTILFHLNVSAQYPRAAENLPLEECTIIDARRSQRLDELESMLEDVYKQPAMAERSPIQPDYSVISSQVGEDDQLGSPPSETC